MAFNWLWLLNGVSLIAIAAISFYCFFIWSKNNCSCKVGKIIGINGIIYFMYGLLILVWTFEAIHPIKSDFILIDGIFSVVKAAILIIIIYCLINNKNLLYLLFLFLLTALALFYVTNSIFLVMPLVSYTIIAIASFDLLLLPNKYLKKAGVFSLANSIISILFAALIFFGGDPSKMMWFIPNLLIFIIFLLFFMDIKYCGLKEVLVEPKSKKVVLPLAYLKFIIFISSITLFILISTISIHEMGHSLAAQYYGCEKSKAVIYDSTDFAHTEMVCEGYYNDLLITLAGILFPILIGFIFLLTGGRFTTNISYLIFGFSLIIPGKDLDALNLSKSVIFVIITSGLLILVYGVIRLSINYIKQKGGISSEREMHESNSGFFIEENRHITDLYELVDELHKMSNIKFKRFIDNRKKDLLDWVGDAIKEKDLAKELKNINDKKETLIIVMNYLLKKEAEYDQNIFRYVCYPILKEKVKKLKEKNANRSPN